ncbi:MAG TPA: YceI family protein [Steroidobacteraceae bacterium]|nr:YceI family protein [Steroidobacteraceae bacterium]
MRVRASWKLLLPGTLLLAILGGCPLPHPRPPPAAPPESAAPALHLGTPYQIVPQASLLTVLVYRGGALASAGHNHVIASHDLSGTIYVPAAILESSFEVHVPVDTLTVDEPALRAQQPAAEFPADVPASAREGTRHNMLGEALLDAQRNPEIVLRALRLERTVEGAADSATVLAHVQSTVRGQLRSFTVPVRYRLAGDGSLEAAGEFPLRQSELGLTPFSAMLGALQVQDEMRVSFHIVARAAAPKR